MHTTSEVMLRAWLSEQCPSVWSLLNSRARTQLPLGFLEYLSPLSEEQLDVQAAVIPELSHGYLLAPWYREQLAQPYAERGRENLVAADQLITALIDICGSSPIGDAYRRELSGVHTGDRLAEILCEIAVCTAVSKFSTGPPRLHPPSRRPGRHTQRDVAFEVTTVRVYGEVKRYPDPQFREHVPSGRKYRLSPIDLYGKLEGVPEQFPEGTVNVLFVYHRSFNAPETLWQALFGWREARGRPMSSDVGPQKEDGLFAREEWREISGCCVCQVSNGSLCCPVIWDNPLALVSMPPLVRGALSTGAVGTY